MSESNVDSRDGADAALRAVRDFAEVEVDGADGPGLAAVEREGEGGRLGAGLEEGREKRSVSKRENSTGRMEGDIQRCSNHRPDRRGPHRGPLTRSSTPLQWKR
jgi:hypothetical protein